MKRLAIPLIILLLLLLLTPDAHVRAACGNTYTVMQGDTLYSIAQKCQLSYVVLTNINYEISNPNLIRPGQVIRLTAEIPLPQYEPTVGGPAQPYGMSSDGETYTVRKGDSLMRIAYRYNTTLDELYRANPDLGGRPVIIPGQVLNIPGGARHNKGWVGVANLYPVMYSTIYIRAADFPPYAPVKFRLHRLFASLNDPGTYRVSLKDIIRTDPASIYVDGNVTDAVGNVSATIKLTYIVSNGQYWVVDVFTDNLGEEDTIARSPIMVIGGTP